MITILAIIESLVLGYFLYLGVAYILVRIFFKFKTREKTDSSPIKIRKQRKKLAY